MSDEIDLTHLGRTLSGYGWVTYCWVFFLSMLGGLASFLGKLRAGVARPFNIVEFVGEIIISGFVGICTFLLCESAGFNPMLSAALIAISGHMGSRGIFLLEQFYARRLLGPEGAASHAKQWKASNESESGK